MQNKSTSIIIGIIVIILALVAIALASNKNRTPAGTGQPTASAFPTGTDTPATSTPITATSTATTTMKSYTLADVALHATPQNCWTAINDSVYDLSGFVNAHPGGVNAISKVCGIDGTAIFNAQHGGGAPQAAQLAKVKIGVLVQ